MKYISSPQQVKTYVQLKQQGAFILYYVSRMLCTAIKWELICDVSEAITQISDKPFKEKEKKEEGKRRKADNKENHHTAQIRQYVRAVVRFQCKDRFLFHLQSDKLKTHVHSAQCRALERSLNTKKPVCYLLLVGCSLLVSAMDWMEGNTSCLARPSSI